MAKVTIRRGDATIEAELSVSELRELAGLNGHGQLRERHSGQPEQTSPPSGGDYEDQTLDLFFRGLSDVGRRFLHFVKAAGTDGIAAEDLVAKMGLENRYQIGGLAGGGLGKNAKRLGIDRNDLYLKEISSENGVRTVIFKPGKVLERLK